LNFTALLFGFADNGNINSLSARFRAARFRRFVELLRDAPGLVHVLDAGGTVETWRLYANALPPNVNVTLLNLKFSEMPDLRGVSYETGDARDLSRFPDRHFHVCFSNSLIEHVATFDEQQVIANEIRRVCRGYFVQTPNLFFPLDPHFLVPAWQFLPISIRSRILQKSDLGWIKQVKDPLLALQTVQSIRLLCAREMKRLFPDSHTLREQIGPLTKSLIACRPIQ